MIPALSDRALFWLLAAFWIVIGLQASLGMTDGGGDFAVFHTAAQRFLHAEQMYRFDEYDPYKYAPGAVMFFLPVALFPQKVAFVVWNCLMAVLLTFFLTTLARAIAPRERLAAHVLVGVLIVSFAHYGMNLGQSDPLAFACVALFWRYRDERPFLSGLAMSVAIMLKLPFLCVAGLAIIRPRQAVGIVVGALLFVLIPVAVYGVHEGVAQYSVWRALLADSTPRLSCYKGNQSLWTFFCTSGDDVAANHLTAIAAAAGAVVMAHGASVLWMWRKDRALAEELALALAMHLAICLSPLGWRANHVGMAAVLYLAWRVRARWVFVPMALILGINYEVLLHNKWLLEQLLLLRLMGYFSLAAALLLSIHLVGKYRSANARVVPS